MARKLHLLNTRSGVLVTLVHWPLELVEGLCFESSDTVVAQIMSVSAYGKTVPGGLQKGDQHTVIPHHGSAWS